MILRITQMMKNWLVIFSLMILPVVVFAADDTSATSFYNNFQDLKFTDQNNKPFSFATLNGKVSLFNFIYTSCSNVCPIQTKELASILKALSADVRQDIRFVSISLDTHDKPKKLKKFAKKMGADQPEWVFLNGSYDDIVSLSNRLRLIKKSDKPEDNAKLKVEDHSTVLWLIDGQGRIMQRYSGAPIDTVRLQKEITTLQSMSKMVVN